jgi:DNA mismatch repair protein MutS2
MDEKTLQTLEYPKILEKLAEYCSFQVSREKAFNLRPTTDIFEARRRLAETSEAIQLKESVSNLTIGGARDVREQLDLAKRGGVLSPNELQDVKSTLVSARNLKRTFERLGEQYPNLTDITEQLPPPLGIIDAVTKAISDRGEILDTASSLLSDIRRDIRIVHDRLLSKLQRMLADPKYTSYLQEPLITQRDGRYVLPVRAEYKGRIKSIVHDQSSSGATLFVEPLAVVDLNNQYREKQLAERDEERRILYELSRRVEAHADEINHTIEVIATLDLVLARGKYSEDLITSEPVLHTIQSKGDRHPGTIIKLYGARHPLLDPETVVAIDVELDPKIYALVVTGPNTGGKTVTLKTIGLLVLMAQSGLPLPTLPGSELSIFKDVYADIGDEQSIEQSLSTFSGHITNIIRIFEHADRESLVILDELGAGTDPQEGAALARAILTHLLDRSVTTLVTTHHPELKAFAHGTPGVVNASVEFDIDTLRPTYHLTIGLPGRSNALSIAERIGLSQSIIDNARSEIRPEDLKADDLLDEIVQQREMARAARDVAESARQDAENLRFELSERLDTIEDERREILEGARAEAEKQITELHAEIDKLRRDLTRARQPVELLQVVEDQTDKLAEKVEEPVERVRPDVQIPRRKDIRLGDSVRLRKLDIKGVISSLSEDEAEVQVGGMRVRTRLVDLELLIDQGTQSTTEISLDDRRSSYSSATQEVKDSSPSPKTDLLAESPGIELHLRGLRAEEAIETLERYLDAAYLAGLPFVRIIHGKGTGKLRQVVRQVLEQHPHIKSFEAGGHKEGGEGVTIAKLDV